MTSVPHFQPLQDSEERNRGKGERKRERETWPITQHYTVQYANTSTD